MWTGSAGERGQVGDRHGAGGLLLVLPEGRATDEDDVGPRGVPLDPAELADRDGGDDAGKPVISTSIQDVVRPYGELNLVSIADDPDDFVGRRGISYQVL